MLILIVIIVLLLFVIFINKFLEIMINRIDRKKTVKAQKASTIYEIGKRGHDLVEKLIKNI
jgi:hypothetical protein